MATFGGTSRSKVGQASSGDKKGPMPVRLSSRESVTREFANPKYRDSLLIYNPYVHSVYNDDEWATEDPPKYQ